MSKLTLAKRTVLFNMVEQHLENSQREAIKEFMAEELGCRKGVRPKEVNKVFSTHIELHMIDPRQNHTGTYSYANRGRWRWLRPPCRPTVWRSIGAASRVVVALAEPAEPAVGPESAPMSKPETPMTRHY
jgi:hypothetical protein